MSRWPNRNETPVLIGQQAAVHALLFVGVTMTAACKIVSCSTERMRPYLCDDMVRQARLVVPLRSMTKEQRRYYNKLAASLPRHKVLPELLRMQS